MPGRLAAETKMTSRWLADRAHFAPSSLDTSTPSTSSTPSTPSTPSAPGTCMPLDIPGAAGAPVLRHGGPDQAGGLPSGG